MLRIAAAFAGVLLACVLYVAFIGIGIDASSRRAEIADKFSASTGREVRIEGALQLVIAAHPSLRVGSFHIANAAGFSGDEFAGLDEARLELDLWSLLLGRLQIEELSGSGVHLVLQKDKTGRNNWTFHPAVVKQQATPAPDAKSASGVSIAHVLARLDIQRISLEKLEVEYTGGDAQRHFFNLDSLVARLPAGEPVTLTLQGAVEKKYPYRLDFTGGTTAELARGDKPWPVALALDFMSSRLSLNGSVTGDSGKIDFKIGTDNLQEFDRLLHTALPAVGKVNLSGTIGYEPGKVRLEKLDGNMGRTTLRGALAFNYSGARPSVQGELALPTLDLRPFMTNKPAVQEEPPKSLADVYREISQATFNLKQMNTMDADLTLRVGQWLSLPGAVRDATLQLKLRQGRLNVPMQVTVGDVALSGSASADASVTPARFRLALGTHNSSLGHLASLFAEFPDVQGHLDRLDLRLSARGDSGTQLMRSLDVLLELERGKLSYGNSKEGKQVQFALDKFAVTLPAGKPLQGEVRGSLLGKNFDAALHGGTLTDIMQQAHTPVDFIFHAGDAKAEVHALLQAPTENSGPEVSFDLAAPHAGEVAAWLGLRPGADARVEIKGAWRAQNYGWRLSGLTLQLGRSALAIELQRSLVQGRPLTRFQLAGELIDLDELQALLPEARKDGPAAAKPASKNLASENLINIPILPTGVSLSDADIAVNIKRIATASPFAMHDLHFDGRIRDGMMAASPFAVNVARTDFNGTILLDLRTQQPHVQLALDAAAMDIGNVLGKLGIGRSPDAAIEHMQLRLDLHSSHLGDLLSHSDMSVGFSGGHYTLRDANTGGAMRIALDRGELKSAAGAPVRLDLNGALDAVPVAIAIQTATAAELLDSARSIPFKLEATTSGATIRLSGDIDRPLAQTDVELALDMRGSRLDNLNALAHTSLPPWGPWSAAGKFHMTSGGYEVSSLQLRVGSSTLNGSGKLDTKAVPPRMDVALTASTIQLDDFRFGNWSPEKSPPVATQPDSEEETRKRGAARKQQVEHLLSKEVLRRQDASLTVRVEQVLSGKDALGTGKLDARLENGRASIGPITIDTPGGSAKLQLDYEPGDTGVALALRAEAKRFDYGILARRANPRSNLSGVFNLDVDVSAHAPSLSELMRYGKGRINFALWPENMEAGVLDIWAVNMLMALLPALDSSKASRVNCAIGEFVLADGKLTDKRILVDTSRMRVTGKGGADFAAERVQFYMQPHAKTPQFLSLAIPVDLGGSFTDFSVGVRAGDVVETVGQLFTSVIWVPLKSLFGNATPADGRDICENPKFK